jgi:putative ABC transport system permease protein
MDVTFAVLGAVFLVVTTNIALSVRERAREIAIMKALGFTPRTIVELVVAESVLTALAAGLIGCVGMRVLFEDVLGRPTVLRYFPSFAPSWSTVLTGLAIALAMGLLSSIVPAVQAARVQVVAGLRQVG